MWEHMRRILLCSSVIMGLATAPISVRAIGISPPTIRVRSIMRNTTQEKTLNIVRSIDDVGDIDVTVEASGPYANYIKLPAQSFTIPAGDDLYKFRFQINPQSAANGEYVVPITFLLSTDPHIQVADGSTVTSIRTGVGADIHFSVGGEEVVGYTLANFQVLNGEVGQMLTARFRVTNTGNVAWTPKQIRVVFTSVHDQAYTMSSVANARDIFTIQPGDGKDIELPIAHELIEGEYQARIYTDPSQSVDQFDAMFQPITIYRTGTLAQKGDLTEVRTNKDMYEIGEKIGIESQMSNTGDVALEATVYAELTREDTIVDTLRSDTLTLLPGKTDTVVMYTDAAQEGQYKITAYMKYANQKTDKVIARYTVVAPTGVFAVLKSWIGLLLLIIGIVLFVWWKKHRRDVAMRAQTLAVSLQPTSVQEKTIVLGSGIGELSTGAVDEKNPSTL